MKKSLLLLTKDARHHALLPQGDRQTVVARLKEIGQTLSPESAAWALGLLAACDVPVAVELSGVMHSPHQSVAIAASAMAKLAVFSCAFELRKSLQKTKGEIQLEKACEEAIAARDKKWMDEKMLWKEIPKASRPLRNPHPVMNDGVIAYDWPRRATKDPGLRPVPYKSLEI